MLKNRSLVDPVTIESLKREFASAKTSALADLVANHSQKIEDQILLKLSRCTSWEDSRPIALGSWGKNQLSVLSDIDLLFLGPDEKVEVVVEHARKQGLELRYRVPLDKTDWSVGVDAYDLNSLIFGKPLFAADYPDFETQLKKIKESRHCFKKIVGAVKSDRMKRHSLHFDLAGHLEPHLKLGPGGARDATHFYVLNFFRPVDKEILNRFHECALEIVYARQALALFGEVEHLRAQEQLELSNLLGKKSIQEFMKSIIQSLNLVKHISDEQLAEINRGKNYDHNPVKLTSKLIKSMRPQKVTTQELAKLFFDSDIEAVFPNWGAVNGLVKHDQYHRFSTESHIYRAVLLLCSWVKKPPTMIKRFTKDFKESDWIILFWAMWFHDIGKGSDEDHSTKGSKIAKEFFQQHKISKDIAKEVIWLVENHLLLSTFAFRHNHQSSGVLAELKKRGVEGNALKRLLVVTVIDIMATNPAAWNTWKEDLLFKLTEHLLSPSVNRLGKLIDVAEKKKIEGLDLLLEHVNETVLLELDPKLLVADFAEVMKAQADLPPKIFKDDRGQIWVRLHKKEDAPGVFYDFIQKIVMTGSQVRHSVVMTLPWGVYDWFHIRSSKDVDVLSRLFKSLEKVTAPNVSQFSQVRFKKIELVSQNANEAIVAFKGLDQRGALMVAAHSLKTHDLEIKWAKVNTFGSQLEDVFGVKSRPDLAEIVGEIHNKLCSTQSVSPPKIELSLD